MNTLLNFISVRLNQTLKTEKAVNAFRRMIAGLAIIMCVGTLFSSPVMEDTSFYTGAVSVKASDTMDALKIGKAVDAETFVENIIEVIGSVAKIIGFILLAFGGFQLIMALKDNDSNGITKAVMLCAIAIVLIFITPLIKKITGFDTTT